MNARRKPKLGAAVWEAALREHGHLSDVDLAKRLGVTPPSVAYQRKKAGFRRVWTRVEGEPIDRVGEGSATPEKQGAEHVCHRRCHLISDECFCSLIDEVDPVPHEDETPQPNPAQRRANPTESVRDWDEILRVYSHLNNREIAQIVGVSHQAVSFHRTRRELPSPSKRRTDAEWRVIFATYPSSTPREIAHAIGCHPRAVYLALRRTGTKPGRRGVARFLPSRVRITPEMVRPFAMQGLSNTKIAEKLGCHWMTVRRVRAGAGIPGSYEIRRLARTRL